jgi:hypothetical protein
MMIKLKLALLLVTVVGLSTLWFMWRNAVAQNEITEQQLKAANAATMQLAKWSSAQVVKLERASSALTAHKNKAILASRTIAELKEQIHNVPHSVCYDQQLPDAAIDSLRRAAAMSASSTSRPAKPTNPPASTQASALLP